MDKLHKEVIEITVGALLMLISFLSSLLMVINILETTYTLCFISYSLSLSGLTLGLHGLYGLLISQREIGRK